MNIIAHLDMDAFFAAVEEKEKPFLKGLPVVVGADPKDGQGRGVVSTANYKAREYGIKSAMPISWAWRESEKAKARGEKGVIFFRPNFNKYEKDSASIFKILKKYSPLVEQASIDEFYFSLNSAKNYKKAKEIAEKIKKEIKRKEKLTASIGIGPNKLISKIASQKQKPDGLTIIKPEKVQEFLDDLSIREIPGIGPKTESLLKNLGIETVKQLRKLSQKKLKDMLGKWGEDLYKKARGKDNSILSEEYQAKSIGSQETFETDTLKSNLIIIRMQALGEIVFDNFSKSGFKYFRTVAITVRFSNFTTITRAHTLEKPQRQKKILELESLKLLLPFLDKRENPRKRLIRLIGLRVEKLTN